MEGGQNRSFGLLLSAICAVVSAVAYFSGGAGYLKWLLLALVLLVVALVMARILAPLRRLWIRFGVVLGHVINPLVLTIIYITVMVPFGVLMRLFGRDPLSLKGGAAKSTYWISRNDDQLVRERLKDQF